MLLLSIVGGVFGSEPQSAPRQHSNAPPCGIHGLKSEKAKVPTQMHFGDKDMHIPMAHVNELRKLHPDVQVFDYPAEYRKSFGMVDNLVRRALGV